MFGAGRYLRLGLLLAGTWLAAGCIGGQTGEAGGSRDTGGGPSDPCRESELDVGLDQPVAGGYTARELIEAFQDETSPAFVLPRYTDVRDRTLTPADASAETEVAIDFAYAGGDRAPLYEGSCGSSELVIAGTLIVTAFDGELVLEIEGHLYGPASHAVFAEGPVRDGRRGPPNPNHIQLVAACTSDQEVHVWYSERTLMGRLCVPQGLVRFPTACGGFAQAPLDQDVVPSLPLPSAVIALLTNDERQLEVVWSDDDRSPLELTISSTSELACYADLTAESGEVATASTTPIELMVRVADAELTIQQESLLVGSPAAETGDFQSVLRGCSPLQMATINALEPRLERPLASGEMCLELRVRADESFDIELTLDGQAVDGPFVPTQRWPVREVMP